MTEPRDPRARRRMLAPRPQDHVAGGQVPPVDDVGLAIVRPLRPEVAAELADDPVSVDDVHTLAGDFLVDRRLVDPLAAAARLELSTEAWQDAAAQGWGRLPDAPGQDGDDQLDDDVDDQVDDVDDDLAPCRGCGSTSSAHHVYGVRTCCPECDHRDPDDVDDDGQDGTVPEDPPTEPEDPQDDVAEDSPVQGVSSGLPAAELAARFPVGAVQLGQGWASRHDPASLEFRVRQLIAAPVTLFDLVRPHGPVLDQGAEGACCGFAAAAVSNVLELEAASRSGVAVPDVDLAASADAFRLYEDAQDLDGAPNSTPGTSVLAAMKAGQRAGWWGSYLWAFGTKDAAQAILQVGAVVFGVPWPVGDVGPDGVIRLEPGAEGAPVGHALAGIGLVRQLPSEAARAFDSRPGPWFVVQNSWGPSWGAEGIGYLHHADLSLLLRGWGECAVPLADQL